METMIPQEPSSQQELRNLRKVTKERVVDTPKMPPDFFKRSKYTKFNASIYGMDSAIFEDSEGGLWVA